MKTAIGWTLGMCYKIIYLLLTVIDIVKKDHRSFVLNLTLSETRSPCIETLELYLQLQIHFSNPWVPDYVKCPQTTINTVFSKNEKGRKPVQGHITKASCSYALLYKAKWKSCGS